MEEKMKRTKLLLSTIVSFLLAFVMVFAVACDSNTGSNGGGNNTDNNEDHGITDSSKDGLALDCISVSGYKKTFTLGDTFTTGDLVVTATLNDYSISDKYTTDVTLNAGEYVVDSSDYNANRVGVYTIYVSHTRSNVTRTAHYEVEVTAVTPAYGGIVAKLADGKTDTYSLSAGESSKVINKDILAVYEIGTNGETGETPVDPELYDAELYLGSKKMENNAATQNGVYSFVAILKADKSQQDFIPVYVINTVSAIELIDGVGTFEQVEGRDTISSTWQFTVTYSNGTTKTVKAGDAGLTVTLDTTVVGESKTANVSYVENDAKGTPHEVTCTVTYKITEKVVSGGTVTNNYSLNITELQAAIKARVQNLEGGNPNNDNKPYIDESGNLSDKIALDPSDFTGANEFLTMLSGYSKNDQYRTTNNGIIEIKGERLQVTFEGTGSIIVSFASTGGSNDSNFGIKKGGSYLTADKDGTTATLVTGDDDAGAYTVKGTSYVTVAYTITAPGTYILCSNLSARGCRINSITMKDVVEGQGGGEEKPAGFAINMNDVAAAVGATSDTAGKTDPTKELKEGTGVYTTSALDVDANGKSLNGISFSYRLKLGGAGDTTKASLKFEDLKAGATITIYAITSSGSDTGRTLSLYDNSGALVPDSTTAGFPNAITEVTFTVPSDGTFYVWGSAAINIYYIAVSY